MTGQSWVYKVPTGTRWLIHSTVTDHRTGDVTEWDFEATATDVHRFDKCGVLRRLFNECAPLVNGLAEIWLGEPTNAQQIWAIEEAERTRKGAADRRKCSDGQHQHRLQ